MNGFRTTRLFRKFVLVFVTALTSTQVLPLCAQQPVKVLLSGHVTDAQGEAISGASIYILDSDYSISTDSRGYFELPVKPGRYNVVISAVGYLAVSKEFTIATEKPLRLQIVLKIDGGNMIEQVVVEGKSAIQEVRETPFNVVALDAKSRYNSTLDLAGLLNKASGVRVRESGGVGSDMNITLNGFTGRNVRVFIDGVPMDGMGSAFQLNNVPVNAAERIEIYKGVVPIEFGADALGGVINIVTNQTANTTVDASYSYGSFNTHKSNLNLNRTFKSGLSFQLNAFQNYSDNDYKVKTGYRIFAADREPTEPGDNWQTGSSWSTDSAWFRRFHDKYRNETIIAKLGIVGKSWADRLLLGLTLGQVHRDIQHGSRMEYVFGERTAHSRSVLPSITYEKRNLLVDGLSVRFNANYNYEKAGSVDTSAYKYSWDGSRKLMADLRGVNAAYGEASLGMSEFSNSNQSSNLSIGYRIHEDHSINFNDNMSYYARKPDLESIANDLYPELPTLADSMTRTSFKNTMGLEYRYTYKRRWNTNVFAKHYLNRAIGPFTDAENVTTKRNESTGKIGYGIATTYFLKDIQLKASAEKAIRLPNDRELFGDEILESGNTALRPEESNNYNIGITLNKELNSSYTIYLDLAGYHRDTYDFIQRLPAQIGDAINGESIFRNVNHGRVTRWGADMEARVYYKNIVTLGGSLSYADIRDKAEYQNVTEGIVNGNYGYRMPNLPYFFWNADASYYVHNFFGKGNTLNLNYAFNFIDQIYLYSTAYGQNDSKAVIPKQLYSDFSATLMLKNGKYNISFEARNLENAFLYDNFSLQKPGRSFGVKLRYFFIKRNNNI